MLHFTPAERRALLLLLLLLGVGTVYDLWRTRRRPEAAGLASPLTRSIGQADGSGRTPGGDAWRGAPARALAGAAAGASGASSEPRRLLDLNRATAEDLDDLPGIGPVLAGRILEFRRRNGPFRRVEDLRAVRGIGPRLLERLRPQVAVVPPGADR